MGYYDNVNEDLLAAIPPDAGRVCEVGCGDGAMATVYRRSNPDCEYYGIELDFAAAGKAKASGVFAGVSQSNVESMWMYVLNAEGSDLDCLLFGDVLEHLKDPWKLLSHVTEHWLKNDGQLIACIPNVQNYMVVGNLLAGSFFYEDQGLLDRTHLRWFTRNSIRDAFFAAGLTITSVEPRNWSQEFDTPHGQFVKTLEPFVLKHKLDMDDFKRDTRAFQWVVKAVKGEAPKRNILIRSIASNLCCNRPRLTEPFKFVATIPGVRYSGKATEVRKDEHPVVIVQRDKFDLDQVRKWVDSGVLVIGEWDDDPAHFECNTTGDYLPIKAVHAVSTTTDYMAKTLSQWNPNVGVFPNQIAYLPEKKTADPNRPARIFCAWQKREEDWKPIVEPLNEVLAEFPETEVYVIHDREFYHAVKTQNKKFWSFQHYEKYMEILGMCDIALLPLEDTEFNRHKSDIKFLECAANGVCAIAQDGSVYGETRAENDDLFDDRGLLYDGTEDFKSHLKACLKNPAVSTIHGGYAKRYLKKHRMLKDHYRDRYSWINALLDTKDELTEQLYERCPILKP